jgi:HEPN domain-containing protein
MKRHNAKDLPALLLEKAREDVAAVEALVDDERVVDGIVLFHAQQAAEKTLKSVLSAKSIPFRMTHDLSELTDQLANSAGPLPGGLGQIGLLTPYATSFRYENLPLEASILSRQTALKMVRELMTWGQSFVNDQPPGGECQ